MAVVSMRSQQGVLTKEMIHSSLITWIIPSKAF